MSAAVGTVEIHRFFDEKVYGVCLPTTDLDTPQLLFSVASQLCFSSLPVADHRGRGRRVRLLPASTTCLIHCRHIFQSKTSTFWLHSWSSYSIDGSSTASCQQRSKQRSLLHYSRSLTSNRMTCIAVLSADIESIGVVKVVGASHCSTAY